MRVKSRKAKLALFLVVIVAAIGIFNFAGNPTQYNAMAAPTSYKMATWISQDQSLYVLSSADGKDFTVIGKGVFSPQGGLRDPSIFKNSDGKYYVAYTKSNFDRWNAGEFGLAYSYDLDTWTQLPDVPIPGATNVWAPEWFVDSDGSIHAFVGVSKDNLATINIYETHPINNHLGGDWSTPVLVFDHPLSVHVIDPYMVKVGNTYYLWFKENVWQHIEYATSNSITGPFTVKASGDFAGWGRMAEGMSLIKVNDVGTWRIYFDQQLPYGGFSQFYSESSDGFKSWSAKAVVKTEVMPRHGTVMPEFSPFSKGTVIDCDQSTTGDNKITIKIGDAQHQVSKCSILASIFGK